MKLALALVMLAALAVRAQADDVSGVYDSTWGLVQLRQAGDQISGSFAAFDGQLHGTYDGKTLRLAWERFEPAVHGEIVLQRDTASAGWTGAWRFPGGADQGEWRLDPLDIGPRAGAFAASIAVPFDVTELGGPARVGVIGGELAAGYRVTRRWYAGVVGGWEFVRRADSTSASRFRVGVEGRYTFHETRGTGGDDDRPAFPTPTTTWLGARAGVETFDGFGRTGEFGELELGTDWWFGRLGLGGFVAAGVSVEPDQAPATGTSTSIYGVLGARLTFD